MNIENLNNPHAITKALGEEFARTTIQGILLHNFINKNGAIAHKWMKHLKLDEEEKKLFQKYVWQSLTLWKLCPDGDPTYDYLEYYIDILLEHGIDIL